VGDVLTTGGGVLIPFLEAYKHPVWADLGEQVRPLTLYNWALYGERGVILYKVTIEYRVYTTEAGMRHFIQDLLKARRERCHPSGPDRFGSKSPAHLSTDENTEVLLRNVHRMPVFADYPGRVAETTPFGWAFGYGILKEKLKAWNSGGSLVTSVGEVHRFIARVHRSRRHHSFKGRLIHPIFHQRWRTLG